MSHDQIPNSTGMIKKTSLIELVDKTATIDQKRNDEQQYHAAGTAHDPHNRTQERIDSGDPNAGDVDEETREQSAPFNKTYGHHP